MNCKSQHFQEAENKRRKELKERELSARRKREEIERKREDQERKRVENEGDQYKGGSRERAGRQGKACTAERVKMYNFLIAE